MKIVVHDVTIRSHTVEVPNKCPHCEADLTAHGAIEETRLCESVAESHLDTSDEADALCSTDSADGDLDYRATLSALCVNCCTEIGVGSLKTETGIEIDTDVRRVEQARQLLREARALLKKANCPKTVERVRLALSSAEGALRNAESRRIASTYRTRKQIRKAPRMYVTTSRRLP